MAHASGSVTLEKPPQKAARVLPAAKSIRSGGNDRGRFDAVDIRKILVKIRFALAGDRALVRALAVATVELLDDVHAGDHFAERGEALAIEKRIVAEIDEQLRGAGIRASRGEGERARRVALGDFIVLDVRVLPNLVDGRIRAEAELHDKAGHVAEEGCVGEKSMLHQIIEPVGAQRSPGARDLHDEVALRGGEFNLKR